MKITNIKSCIDRADGSWIHSDNAGIANDARVELTTICADYAGLEFIIAEKDKTIELLRDTAFQCSIACLDLQSQIEELKKQLSEKQA